MLMRSFPGQDHPGGLLCFEEAGSFREGNPSSQVVTYSAEVVYTRPTTGKQAPAATLISKWCPVSGHLVSGLERRR